MAMFEVDRQRNADLGGTASSALLVFFGGVMQARPVFTIQIVAETVAAPFPIASAALERLTRCSFVQEASGRKRGPICVFSAYLPLLDRGADPLRG